MKKYSVCMGLLQDLIEGGLVAEKYDDWGYATHKLDVWCWDTEADTLTLIDHTIDIHVPFDFWLDLPLPEEKYFDSERDAELAVINFLEGYGYEPNSAERPGWFI